MTQVEVLISLLKQDWVSTADAFGSGICSFHRRLADLREGPHRTYISDGKNSRVRYLVDGKSYDLKSQERNIETRWGVTKIKLWRLVRAK